MTTPEGTVKDRVKRLLKEYLIFAAGSKDEMAEVASKCNGWYYMPMKGVVMGVNGIPDFVGVCKGLFFAIETKAPGKEMTANQIYRAAGIYRGGGKFFLIDGDVSALDAWLRRLV